MATVVQKNYSDIRPIRYELRDVDRSLDLNVPNKYISQQGTSFLEYKFLLSANDIKNKNYTSNILTDTKEEGDIFDLNFDQNISNSFISTIKFPGTDKYLTIMKNNSALSASVALSALSSEEVNPSTPQSFVIQLSSHLEKSVCQIYTYDGLFKKYLVQNRLGGTGFPDLVFDTISDSEGGLGRATFNITRDNNFGFLSLDSTTNTSASAYISTKQFVIGVNPFFGSNALTAISGFDNTFTDYNNLSTLSAACVFEFQSLNDIDTNYNKYSNNFVHYVSGVEVDRAKTLSGQKHNFIFYNNYESNYLSGDEVKGSLSYFNLKNQVSNNYNINKALPFSNPQQQRYYNSILNNETEETSNENLKLGYNFHTAEYLFEPDKYTKFKLPDDILPYKNINLNDADLQSAGAYAAESPYFSDRIYKLLDESNNNTKNEENGTFLCSWLCDKGSSATWYDRYYLPNYLNQVTALSGTANVYTSQIRQLSAAYGLNRGLSGQPDNNMYFYDIPSTMSLEPSATYYYARVGKSYVAKTLNGISDRVIKTNIDIHNTSNDSIISEQDKLILDGKVYDQFSYPLPLDSDQAAISLSFSLNVPSISSAKAYQLIGNNYNTGISISKNFYYTPYSIVPLTISDGGAGIGYYDHNFNLVKHNTFPGISAVKDVIYLTQTNDIVLLCKGQQGSKLLRVNYNGDIVRESNDGIGQTLVDQPYTSRVIYGITGKAFFKTPTGNMYNLDLQTLQVDTINSTPGESVVLSSYGGLASDIAYISGFNAVNIDGKYAASMALSSSGYGNGSSVLFTEYATGNKFVGITSKNDKIWDINAFDNKLFLQSNNQLHVFNTEREKLSTINLSTSAVSGYKIDFISEDYVVNPVVYSRNSAGDIIVDKINTTENNTISTYSLGTSSVDLGYPNSGQLYYLSGTGNFFNPSNIHSMHNTFKNYEDKFCFITRFDNENIDYGTLSAWNTYSDQYSGFPASWNSNYIPSGSTLIDNSTIKVLNLKEGYNCLQMDLDLVTGRIKAFINGDLAHSFRISSGIKQLKNYLYNKFYIGAPNWSTGSIVDYKTNPGGLAKNMIIKDLNVFNDTLSKDLLKYLYLNCVEVIDSVNFDIPTSYRNNTETINNFYTYKIPGNLSNKIKILIKNGGLSVNDQIILETELKKRLSRYLPSTINANEVEFDFRIGNDQPVPVAQPVTLQPRLPLQGSPFSNVFDPGAYITYVLYERDDVTAPVLFERDGATQFMMVT